MHIQDENSFKIRDLNQAAYLLANSYELLGVSWNGRVAWWQFKDHDGHIQDKVREFVNGKASGSINDFASAQRSLKQSLTDDY